MTDLLIPYDHRLHEASCMAAFESNVPRFFTSEEREAYRAFLLDRKGCAYFVLPGDKPHAPRASNGLRACGGYELDDYGVAHLVWIAVPADLHSQGYGRRIIRPIIDRVRAAGHAWCIVLDTSQLTEAFYERFGFHTIRVVPDGYREGLHKHYMRLLL